MAYSGGRDSTALLHASLHAARDAGLQVHALHVHHGLSPNADAWLAHCERQCTRWAAHGLPLHLHARRLTLGPARGESVEAAAREARYAALAAMAREAGCSLVLLAQHRRDQAETWLLQALRGAGAAGLAAMPASVERDGLVWARPWLAQPREAIEAYVKQHRLSHIEDDSNADARFARNRLRLAVWPALTSAFPGAEASLADAARRSQQALECLADLAALDLAACTDGEALDLAAWQRLAPHRAVNALQRWLRQHSACSPSAAELERLERELRIGAGPAVWTVQVGSVRRYRGRLRFAAGGVEATASAAPREARLGIRSAGRYALPAWGGVLVAERVAEGGIALARLGSVSLRARSGGERLRLGTGRPSRSLKQHYQAAGVPAWAREGPLVYEGDGDDQGLLFVPGLGIDAGALAPPGEPQLRLRWEALPDAAGTGASGRAQPGP